MLFRTVARARSFCNSQYNSFSLSRSSIPGICTSKNARGLFSLPIRSMASQGKRRFAPLGSSSADGSDGDEGVQKLKGIVFDMDGTLCMFFSSSLSLIEPFPSTLRCEDLHKSYEKCKKRKKPRKKNPRCQANGHNHLLPPPHNHPTDHGPGS